MDFCGPITHICWGCFTGMGLSYCTSAGEATPEDMGKINGNKTKRSEGINLVHNSQDTLYCKTSNKNTPNPKT